MTVQPKNPTIPNKRPEKEIATSIMPPGKYEVTPEQTFEIQLFLKEFKGRWVVVDRPSNGVTEQKVVFRVWNFEEMLDLRRRATNYDPTRRTNIVDNDLLNRLKIQKLLISWTFAEENKRLQIQHVGGVLTDESWKAFTKLSPVIAERIINEMNLVLENGG